MFILKLFNAITVTAIIACHCQLYYYLYRGLHSTLCFIALMLFVFYVFVLDPKDSGLDFRNLLKHKYAYCFI